MQATAIPAGYLSVSQIRAFLQCPRQYRLRYVDKLRPEFRSVALAFGTSWHEAIDHFLASRASEVPLSTDALLAVFRSALVRELEDGDVPVLFDDEETDIDSLIARARDMFDVFRREYAMPARVLALEEPFAIELAHPATHEPLGLPLVGALDAIVERDGDVVVLEVKSAKRRWSADQLEQDLQGTAYRMAARSLGYGETNVEIVITTKATKPVLQTERLVRHKADEDELLELAFDFVKAIAAGIDHRNRGWQCRGCAYAGACAR